MATPILEDEKILEIIVKMLLQVEIECDLFNLLNKLPALFNMKKPQNQKVSLIAVFVFMLKNSELLAQQPAGSFPPAFTDFKKQSLVLIGAINFLLRHNRFLVKSVLSGML